MVSVNSLHLTQLIFDCPQTVTICIDKHLQGQNLLKQGRSETLSCGLQTAFFFRKRQNVALPQAIVSKFKLKLPSESFRTNSSQTSDGREGKFLCICRLKTQNGACSKNACSRCPKLILCGEWLETSQWKTFDSKKLSNFFFF